MENISSDFKEEPFTFNQEEKSASKRISFQGKRYLVMVSDVENAGEAERALKEVTLETTIALAVMYGVGVEDASTKGIKIAEGRAYQIKKTQPTDKLIGEVSGNILFQNRKQKVEGKLKTYSNSEKKVDWQRKEEWLNRALTIIGAKNAAPPKPPLNTQRTIKIFADEPKKTERYKTELPEWNFDRRHLKQVRRGSIPPEVLENLEDAYKEFKQWLKLFEEETGISVAHQPDEKIDGFIKSLDYIDPIQFNLNKLNVLNEKFYKTIVQLKKLPEDQKKAIRSRMEEIRLVVNLLDKLVGRYISNFLISPQLEHLTLAQKEDLESAINKISRYYYSDDPKRLIKEEIAIAKKAQHFSKADNLIGLSSAARDLEGYIDKIPFQNKEHLKNIIQYFSQRIMKERAVIEHLDKQKTELEKQSNEKGVRLRPTRGTILAHTDTLRFSSLDAFKFYLALVDNPEKTISIKEAMQNGERYLFDKILKNLQVPKKGHLENFKNNIKILLDQNPEEVTKANCLTIQSALENLVGAFTVLAPSAAQTSLTSLYQELEKGAISREQKDAYETVRTILEMGAVSTNPDLFLKIQSLFEGPGPAAGG